MQQDCVFCKIVAGEWPATKVYESETILAFRDIHPVAPTHILVVPKKHIARLTDLTVDDAPLMGELLLAAKIVATQEGIGEGFRVVINNGASVGQSIRHLHLHLLSGRRMIWPPG